MIVKYIEDIDHIDHPQSWLKKHNLRVEIEHALYPLYPQYFVGEVS